MTSPDPRGARDYIVATCSECHDQMKISLQDGVPLWRCDVHGFSGIKFITVTEVQSSPEEDDLRGLLEAAVNESHGSYMSLVAAIKGLAVSSLSAGAMQRRLAELAEAAPNWDGPTVARRAKAVPAPEPPRERDG